MGHCQSKGVTAREAFVDQVAAASPEAGLGVLALRALVLGAAYTTVDATGANPMVTCMALARRTAGNILSAT